MRKIFLLLILLGFFVQSQAQYSTRWKRYRYELVYGLGATNFLGELGGADKVGTNFIRDFEFSMTRPAITLGLRYKILEKLSTKVSLNYGVLRGDDRTTDETYRHNRNLNFYAHLVEFGGHIEYSVVREKIGHRYNLRRVRGLKGFKLNTYFFTGIAGFYFNPYGKHPVTGEWVALQPLGTEGQGMVGSREKYSRFQLAIPFGIGFKYGLNREWSIGLELGARKTFTDYIDDVSTTYYDNAKLAAVNPLAAEMADPSLGEVQGQAGANQQRGDPKDYDSYMFLTITVNYKLKTTRSGLPKFSLGGH
ncbi:MAG: outer membrane beta-barrel protein [Bacteroidales bacterium]|nr:outer membrane beta-barrel protein [Bacteroidales bacterium]